MHTVLVIAAGFALLIGCTLVGRALGGVSGIADGALVFLPLWLLGAGINLLLGVRKAGYPFAAEVPIFLVVFAVPAIVAVVAWWMFHRA